MLQKLFRHSSIFNLQSVRFKKKAVLSLRISSSSSFPPSSSAHPLSSSPPPLPLVSHAIPLRRALKKSFVSRLASNTVPSRTRFPLGVHQKLVRLAACIKNRFVSHPIPFRLASKILSPHIQFPSGLHRKPCRLASDSPQACITTCFVSHPILARLASKTVLYRIRFSLGLHPKLFCLASDCPSACINNQVEGSFRCPVILHMNVFFLKEHELSFKKLVLFLKKPLLEN